MSMIEELERLEKLHGRGVLSETEFSRAKTRLLDGPATARDPLAAAGTLRRSRGDRWFAGICGGLAQATHSEAWIWRLAFSLLFFFGGTGLLIYLLMWVFVPAE